MDPAIWQLAKPILAGQARHALTVAAGALIAKGALDPSQQDAFVTIGLGLATWGVSGLWSWWQKRGQAALEAELARTKAMLASRQVKS